VAISFRDFPLSFHQFAEKAAEAANCAYKQGKYWEFHDALFANQSALDVPALKKQAETLGLKTDDFNQCLDSGEMKAEIDKDMAAGQTFGVSGTPASFINGRMLPGAQPFEGFQKVIDEELQMKGLPVPTAQAAPSAPPAQVTK
jgi:protein-disulfide isomerase